MEDEAVELARSEPCSASEKEKPCEPDVLALLGEISQRLERMELNFEDKIRHDRAREAIVDRLHEENRAYREDLLLRILRPVLMDLIEFHDDLSRAIAAAQAADVPDRAVLEQLQEFQRDITNILYRREVEAFTCEGEVFDPRRQRAQRRIPAPTPETVGQVAQRLRPGFAIGERVLRPEQVAVFVQPPPGENKPLTEQGTNP